MKQVHIRLEDKLIKKIDKLRGDIPRTKFLAKLIAKGV